MIDKIVEETRKEGDRLFGRYGNDMHAVAEYLRERERQAGRKVVAMPAKKPREEELTQVRSARQAYIESFKRNRKALPPKAPVQSSHRKKAG